MGALLWGGTCLPDAQIRIPLAMLNRHGLVAGATGTGKTKTLRLIAEQFSAGGVPVFLADIKGDVSGVAAPGAPNDRVTVQHALRAFAPDDAKALRSTVRTFPHSRYDLEELLTRLGIGEAVITVLSENGAPTPVAAPRLRAPRSLMGPWPAAELEAAVKGSSLYGRYAQAVDRESAYEKLSAGQEAETAGAAEAADRAAVEGAVRGEGARGAGKAAEEDVSLVEQVVASGMFRSLARSVGTQLGREISRSLFGTARRRR
ncbi:helicase HerA-like domain-containing protein [Streptomyces sp. NPDC004728]|uniref:helicase HerA-like domain-containing protein n=1 Tax=Streptomyces sp. NPDC004728 TaxID=3154289 RepID=UPI0033B392F6